MFVVRADYPPFTTAEAEDLGHRIQQGRRLTREETDRLRSQSPVVEGSLIIVAGRNGVNAKRYVGVDLSEL